MIARVLQFECARYFGAAEFAHCYLFQCMRSALFEIHWFLYLQDKVRITERADGTHQAQVPQSQRADQLFVALHVITRLHHLRRLHRLHWLQQRTESWQRLCCCICAWEAYRELVTAEALKILPILK